jgi:hypothetical protein
MLLSPEIRHYSSIVLSVRDLGTTSACRHRVRPAEFGGVGEQGRVSPGLAWNTGDPSRMLVNHPDPGRYRISTTKNPRDGGRTRTRQEASHQLTIPSGKPIKRAGGEASGSLRLLIVAIETWRSADGSEPWSSEGRVPHTGTNAHRHGPNPQRK